MKIWFLLLIIWLGVGNIPWRGKPAAEARVVYTLCLYGLIWWGILHFMELV